MVVVPTIRSGDQTVEKVVKGKTCVYERIPYYNTKIRNTSYHYRYVGGMMTAGQGRLEAFLQGAASSVGYSYP